MSLRFDDHFSLTVPFVLLCLFSGFLQASSVCKQVSPLPELPYRVVNSYPHKPDLFTQGLLIDNDLVYESSGLKGKSALHVYTYPDGTPIRSIKLPNHLFGEGLAVVGDKLIQLTYKARKGLVYDKQTLNKVSEFSYPTEGWGLTYDGEYLVLSNGTAALFYLDDKNYSLIKKIEVLSEGRPLPHLNELEYINGKIFANIWHDNRIAVIDPKSGCNTGWINLSGLRKQFESKQKIDVLNGIAYIKSNGHILVTGKWWPKLFEIELLK